MFQSIDPAFTYCESKSGSTMRDSFLSGHIEGSQLKTRQLLRISSEFLLFLSPLR